MDPQEGQKKKKKRKNRQKRVDDNGIINAACDEYLTFDGPNVLNKLRELGRLHKIRRLMSFGEE
jgi:hypothetical protein